ncbi:MAG: DNA-3-methyladenine glycosylase II, partial [Saprospiraceae bacterium]
PEPKQIIKMDIETLRSVGLSRQKASYIQHVADFFITEKLMDKEWSKIPDDDIVTYLTQIKGVGKWTVQMILMFTLNRPDVFPIDDLGIQNAMIRLYKLEGKYSRERTDQKALREELHLISENWSPYRTIACRYLWKYLHQ